MIVYGCSRLAALCYTSEDIAGAAVPHDCFEMKELLDLLRRNKLFFLIATLAALALRLFFVFRYPHIAGDTFIYGDIAKNWLNHGIYGLTDVPGIHPTLIRLPGYPGFLALMFSFFGQE